MVWFKRKKKAIEQPTPPDERRVKTEGLWMKCPGCRTIVWKKDLESNARVCPKCQHHFRLNARQRLELLLDGRWIEHDAHILSNDPLHFVDTKPYAARLKEARRKLQMSDAVLTAEGLLAGRAVICCSMEFAFIGGSMGAVVGEKVALAIERALDRKTAAGDRLLLRRRAHDGRHAEPDAARQSFRGACAARRSAHAVHLRAHRSHHGRRHGQLCDVGRSEYRRAGRADRLRRPSRDRTDHSPKIARRFSTRPNSCWSTVFLTPWFTAKTSKRISPTRSIFSWHSALSPMNYDQAVRYLFTLGRELASPQQARALKFDLENITALTERLGHPERFYPTVHVAGTNGKGSTAAMLASILARRRT